MAAAFLVQGLILPLVGKLGQGNTAKGWSLTIGVFALLSIIFFVITFFSVRERIQPDPKQKSSVKQDFADLLQNAPWLSMFILTLFVFITLALWGSAMFYYFTYYVDKEHLFGFLRSWGLATAARAKGHCGTGFSIPLGSSQRRIVTTSHRWDSASLTCAVWRRISLAYYAPKRWRCALARRTYS
jgi:hypothetical protein